MEPWAIEEIVWRPALTLLACLLVPFASAAALRALLPRRELAALRGAATVVGFAQIQIAWMAGATALGPELVAHPSAPASLGFGAACAIVTFVCGGIARRREERLPARSAVVSRLRLVVLAIVPALALIAIASLAGAHAPLAAALVASALAIGLVPRSALRELGEDARARTGVLLGAVLSAMLVAGTLAAWTLTAIEPDAVATATEAAARWRLRVSPWDSTAMLAAGWSARERGSHERALAWAREARMHGAPEAATLELEAEVQAARGDCETARATFDRALRARTRAAFEDPLSAPLELGGYRLPPSIVTRCGGLDAPNE